MGQSITKNYIYNLLELFTGFAFPLVTFPYASRVILADGIGQVNFYNSIISYIVLATGLGIPMYAIKEVARVRDNMAERTKTVCEILSLNIILSILGYIIVFVLSHTVPELNDNLPLFFLLSLSIILNTIGCTWFYKGIEEFRYITIRGLIVKFISLPVLFLLVKTKDDVFYYGCFLIIATLGNNIINFVTLKKHVDLNIISIKELKPFRHVKPALSVFAFYLITSFYLHLDTIMLGFLSGNASVGFYTAATKVSHMVNQLITSIGTVMLPRLSNLVATNNFDEFKRLATRSYELISFCCYPIFIGLIIMAPIFIRLLSGTSYEPAITTLQIISPILIALPLSNLIGIQILFPYGKIKYVNMSCCIGAVVNLILNLLLIPLYAQDGAAIATVIAEVSVTLSQYIIARKYIPFRLFTFTNFKYIIYSLIMAAICYYMMLVPMSDMFKLVIVPFIGAIVYAFITYKNNNYIIIEFLYKIRRNR